MIKSVRWKTRLKLLSPDEIQAIHAASLQIMERTGLVMPLSRERQDQARDLGLKLHPESHRLHFPPHLVEVALKQAPGQYTLCASRPEDDLLLDGRQGYLSLDGSGTDILDPDTGQVRPSTKADLVRAIRLAEALPEIAFLWPAVSAGDAPARVQPLHELEVMLAWSGKHIQAMTAVDPLNAQGAVDMAAEVAGGLTKLRQRPLISNFQCSLSPLSYDGQALEAAWVFGQAGIPTGFMNMTIGCSTAPATLAGNMALANAEVLAGITLFQLFFPGTPTFYGSSATMMELRRGGVTCGGPEDFLLQAAASQLAHFYGLPASIGTFATGARASDWQAGLENGISGAISQLTGADMMSGAGLLYAARIFSCQQLVLDCEIFDMLRVMTEGFEVNSDTLALEVIDAVGPRRHFMTEDHTLAHLRQLWQPTIIDRQPWEKWLEQGRPAPAERAGQKARDLLARPQEPLPAAARLAEIVAAYEQMAAGLPQV